MNSPTSAFIADLPKKTDDRFRYFDFSSLKNTARSELNQVSGITDALKQQILETEVKDGLRLVLINGKVAAEYSQLPNHYLCNHPHPELLASSTQLFNDLFTHYSTQNEASGYKICINAEVQAPIYIDHFLSGSEGLLHGYNQIKLNRGINATIIERQFASGEKLFHNLTTDINLEASSNLTFARVNLSPHLDQIGSIRCQQKGNSFSNFTLPLGGEGTQRQTLTVELQEDCAEMQVVGGSVGLGAACHELEIQVKHNAKRSKSTQRIKSVLRDQAQFSFHGSIDVAQGMGGVNAQQSCHNLLTGPDVRTHFKPQLKIDCEDVRCSHGATSSQLREDEVYYLQSRGIPKNVAEKMLLSGYIAAQIEGIRCSEIKKQAATVWQIQ